MCIREHRTHTHTRITHSYINNQTISPLIYKIVCFCSGFGAFELLEIASQLFPTTRTITGQRMITLELPYPPSINHYWRHVGSRTLISRAGREFRDVMQAEVMRQVGRPEPLTDAVELLLMFTAPDRRRRDLDNLLKPALDALTHAGVWEDDSQVVRIDARWSGEPVKPGAMRVVIIKSA